MKIFNLNINELIWCYVPGFLFIFPILLCRHDDLSIFNNNLTVVFTFIPFVIGVILHAIVQAICPWEKIAEMPDATSNNETYDYFWNKNQVVKLGRCFNDTQEQYSRIQSNTRLYSYGNWASALGIIFSSMVNVLLIFQTIDLKIIYPYVCLMILFNNYEVVLYSLLSIVFFINGMRNLKEAKCRDSYILFRWPPPNNSSQPRKYEDKDRD
jgi:hypothetical protein